MWTKNSSLRRARVQAVARGRLARLGLAGHPGFRFRAGLEGYADYVFGARAGPSVDTHNLFHELAHAAQFGPELFRQRVSMGSFVFKMRRVTVFGQRYAEPLTSGATVFDKLLRGDANGLGHGRAEQGGQMIKSYDGARAILGFRRTAAQFIFQARLDFGFR